MTTDQIFQILRNNIIEIEPELENTPITSSDSMKQLGVPSVSRVEILMLTMESLGIVVPNSELTSARNIGEVVDVFAQHMNSPAR
jgi:polyketide biosynthesis acyl carrier protein